MKVVVNQSTVSLDFETQVPITLSCRFATDTVAYAAARAIAKKLGLQRIHVDVETTGLPPQMPADFKASVMKTVENIVGTLGPATHIISEPAYDARTHKPVRSSDARLRRSMLSDDPLKDSPAVRFKRKSKKRGRR